MNIHDELVGRAREIAPEVAKVAGITESEGKMSDAVLDRFCDAGLMQTLVPKMYGGHELGYRTHAAIISEIAPYCTSTAWVLSFYLGHNFIHTMFPKASQDEVFAERPYVLTPGTIAPNFKLIPEGDGFIASGQSSWNSGSSRSDWYLACGLIMREGQAPEARAFLVPSSKATYVENWDVAGMRGTSSSDMALDQVFIPSYHTLPVTDLLNGTTPGAELHAANSKYSMPLFPFILGEAVPVMVGAYRGAANSFKALTEARMSTFSKEKASAKQSTQMHLGRAMAGAEIAEDLMSAYINFIENTDAETMKKPETRAFAKARVGMLLNYCADGISNMMVGAGAASFRNDCSLQRFFRDMNMLRLHGLLDCETATETYGRVLLGLNPTAPM